MHGGTFGSSLCQIWLNEKRTLGANQNCSLAFVSTWCPGYSDLYLTLNLWFPNTTLATFLLHFGKFFFVSGKKYSVWMVISLITIKWNLNKMAVCSKWYPMNLEVIDQEVVKIMNYSAAKTLRKAKWIEQRLVSQQFLCKMETKLFFQKR